jgi:hypothetical protein
MKATSHFTYLDLSRFALAARARNLVASPSPRSAGVAHQYVPPENWPRKKIKKKFGII